jgi:hypothetical protein
MEVCGSARSLLDRLAKLATKNSSPSPVISVPTPHSPSHHLAETSARCLPKRKAKELGQLVLGCRKLPTQPNLPCSPILLLEFLSSEIRAVARGYDYRWPARLLLPIIHVLTVQQGPETTGPGSITLPQWPNPHGQGVDLT